MCSFCRGPKRRNYFPTVTVTEKQDASNWRAPGLLTWQPASGSASWSLPEAGERPRGAGWGQAPLNPQGDPTKPPAGQRHSRAFPPPPRPALPGAWASTSLSIFSFTTWHLWSLSLPCLAVALPHALKGQHSPAGKETGSCELRPLCCQGRRQRRSPHRRSSKLVAGDRGGGEDLTLTLRHAPSSFWGFPNAAFLQLLTWGTDYNDTFVPSKTRGRKVSGQGLCMCIF